MAEFSVVSLDDMRRAKGGTKSAPTIIGDHLAWARATIAYECAKAGIKEPGKLEVLPRRAVRSDSNGWIRVSQQEYDDFSGLKQEFRGFLFVWDKERKLREGRKESTGITHYDWSYSDGKLPGRIRVSYGTDWTAYQMVVLHELSHWLLPKEHHSVRFFEFAFKLYEEYGIPRDFYEKEEMAYKPAAAKQAARNIRTPG